MNQVIADGKEIVLLGGRLRLKVFWSFDYEITADGLNWWVKWVGLVEGYGGVGEVDEDCLLGLGLHVFLRIGFMIIIIS